MPPTTKANRSTFTKHVDFAEKDADEHLVTGIVMVPDKVDLQGDYVREAQIEAFADSFEALLAADEGDGGIMHAAWPSDWMDLAVNGIAGKTFPDDAPVPDDIDSMDGCIAWAEDVEEIDDPAAFCQFYNVEESVADGAWLQTWRVNDDELWSLIEDGVLDGFSIGARDVTWDAPVPLEDLDDDIAVAADYDGERAWEITDGLIREVSTVDIPAVPDAEMLARKDGEKHLGDYLGNQEAFMEEAMQRGHDEADAERLWLLLTRAIEVDGAASPGKDSLLERLKSVLTGSDDGNRPEAPDLHATVAETPDDDPRGRTKEGRTLSRQNRDSLFATVDAALDILEDAGQLPPDVARFTDRDDVNFDLSEHEARTWADPDEEPDEDDTPDEEENANDAPGGDTPDSTTMTDNDPDNDEGEGGKALPEQNAEQLSELTDAVKDLTEAITGPEPKTASIELDGETYELPEAQMKAALGVDEDDDLADKIEALEEQIDQQERTIERINQQSGTSTQLDAAAETGDGAETESGLDRIAGELS